MRTRKFRRSIASIRVMETLTPRKAWKARRLPFVVVRSILVVPAAHAAEPSVTPILAFRCHKALDRDGQ
jgi:hypothetical protein